MVFPAGVPWKYCSDGSKRVAGAVNRWLQNVFSITCFDQLVSCGPLHYDQSVKRLVKLGLLPKDLFGMGALDMNTAEVFPMPSVVLFHLFQQDAMI